MTEAFAIKCQNIVINGELRPATLIVKNQKFAAIKPFDYEDHSLSLLRIDEGTILPGIVETHAHINEPGRTEWEGFLTATKAASAGGITTIVDMPLNSIPPTTTAKALKQKIQSAEHQAYIDIGFWGGVVPDNLADLDELIAHGALGCKAFLIDSGVAEFPMVGAEHLKPAMQRLEKKHVPLLVHAELETAQRCARPRSPRHSERSEESRRDPSPPDATRGAQDDGFDIASISSKKYNDYLNSRPENWEVQAIQLMINLTKDTGCHVHIVHLSASAALADIAKAKQQKLAVTVETCPHYLIFASEAIPDGATYFKCAPPIRSLLNQKRLWQGLKEQTIDMIVSDHSPCSPQLKQLESGDFTKAWGGISGLQFSLPAVWTKMKDRGFSLVDLVRLMAKVPAQLAHIDDRKGLIAPGHDADFIIFHPDKPFRINSSQIFHRHKLTPYDGMELIGVVEKTFVRGQCVYDQGKFIDQNSGKLLLP